MLAKSGCSLSKIWINLDIPHPCQISPTLSVNGQNILSVLLHIYFEHIIYFGLHFYKILTHPSFGCSQKCHWCLPSPQTTYFLFHVLATSPHLWKSFTLHLCPPSWFLNIPITLCKRPLNILCEPLFLLLYVICCACGILPKLVNLSCLRITHMVQQ